MAFGIVYPQYWLIVERSFLLHLNVIKSTFCVARRIVDGIMVPPLLDSHMFNVQSSCFKFTMSHNVEGAMVEHLELNPMTILWIKINSSPFLSENFNEYNKLAKIVMVQMFVSIEDEKIFNNLFIMKNKLWLTIHLDLCV